MKRLPKITVCGVQELEDQDLNSFSHVVSIWDAVWQEREGHERQFRKKLSPSAEVHFSYFDDIPTPQEDRVAPNFEQIREILTFGTGIDGGSSVLIHCWAGLSRSTAVAYALLCQATGPEKEKECLKVLRQIRPQAIPNSLIVTLAEIALGRNGTMFAAYEEMISRLVVPCDDDDI